MGEKTGFLTVLILFAVAIIPFLFHGFNEQVKSNRFLTISNEVHQLVSSEGGVTDKVSNTVNNLEEKGIFINFKDEGGNTVSGKVDPGERILIEYEYDGYKTNNTVIVLRR